MVHPQSGRSRGDQRAAQGALAQEHGLSSAKQVDIRSRWPGPRPELQAASACRRLGPPQTDVLNRKSNKRRPAAPGVKLSRVAEF